MMDTLTEKEQDQSFKFLLTEIEYGFAKLQIPMEIYD